MPDFRLAEFSLPNDLPLVLPSALVHQRPDIQTAEALLHAANADYGVAVARLYPQIELSASLGSQALTTGALFGGAAGVWSVLAQLTQPLFDAGLPAEKRASLATLDAAAAHYQGVVLDALRDVADALRALDHDAQALAALAAADAAAHTSLASIERQYALGSASYVQVLLARQQAQRQAMSLITAQAQRLADSAALSQALGGGTADDR
jgi:outer membrane protein TolC